MTRLDIDRFDDMWFMLSEYTMDGDFLILEDTVDIKDDEHSISEAQAHSRLTSNPKYFAANDQ